MTAVTSTAAALSFETQVVIKSTRNGDTAFAVGYYVSLRLLLELNARSPPHEQVSNAALLQVVQVGGNARMFKRSSFAVHERVDDLLLAESDARSPSILKRHELTRLQQVDKRASHTKFCERIKGIAPNGDKLLNRLQQALTSALTKYSREPDYTESVPNVADADGILDFSLNQRVGITPVPTSSPDTELWSSSRPLLRAMCPLFPVLQVPNATLDNIRHETSVVRAYEIFQKYPLRFTAYRVFFKNDHTKLATDISRCCMDKLTKAEIRKWIRGKVGPIPVYSAKTTSGEQQASKKQQSARARPSAFFNWELRHLALVAVALTVYGEHVLSALYDTQAMEQWKDIPLVSDEVRDASKQRLCLQRARVNHNGLNTSGEFHAAHYLPLDLTIQWNNALQPELRLSAKDLSAILNLQCNMKAVRKRVNIKDHRKVEHFIATFIKQSGSHTTPKCASWLVWRNTKDRLEQIARRVQSQELRTAFLKANGQELYALIGRTFQQIEDDFTQRGYDFGRIWDWQEANANDNTSKARPAMCELLR